MLLDPEGQGDPDALLDALTLDTPETATATPEAPPATAEPGAEVDSGSPAPPESPAPDTAPAADAAPTTPVVDPNVIAPPVGGEPFTFSVDGRHITVDGARVVGDDILIPKTVWFNQIRPNYLGDRGAWREEKRSLQREIAARNAGQSEESRRAKALVGVVDQLFADPERLMQAAQNWQVEGPKLRAEAEANVYKSELERYRQQEEQARAQKEEADLLPILDNTLAQSVEGLLAEAGVQWQGNETEQARWKGFVQALEEDIGFGNLFTKDHRGQIQLDEDKVRRVFNRELARARSEAQATRVVEKKAALNTATVAPAKPIAPAPGKPAAKAPSPPPRDEKGQFTALDRKRQKQAARALLDDMSLDDAMA